MSHHPADQPHYTTEQVRERLAFGHVNDVVRLIEDKKLFARQRRGARAAKGKHRWIVPASAVTEYVEAMGTNRDEPANVATGKAAGRRRRSGRSALAGVTKFI